MANKQEQMKVLRSLVLILILALAVGILVYTGGLLLQVARLTSVPEPNASFEGIVVGALLGIGMFLLQRLRNKRQKPDSSA